MSIFTLLNQIDKGEIVLPAIQRDFVWGEEKIEKLMDSIMRGYPIGIVLMWETFDALQYRTFEKNFGKSSHYSFYDNDNKNIKIVLDGQQRLQSLYIALYGQYKGKYLYFDVLSGDDNDDFEEERYVFRFGTEDECEIWNEQSIKNEEQDKNRYFYKVIDAQKKIKLQDIKAIINKSGEAYFSDEERERFKENCDLLSNTLTHNHSILSETIIDHDLSPSDPERKTESDILEIFVRINRQGTPLSRSDLIFSMLKLKWKNSAIELPKFIERVNEGNAFDIDVDFVIRCLFAVSDLGTKFNIDLLRKQKNMKKMQDSYQKCCEAINATVDSVIKHCWVSNSKVFGGTQNLVPFVYYLYYMPKHEIPNDQVESFRKAFFYFCFAGPFSRYADSRLGKFIREELKPRIQRQENTFPLNDAVKWVHYWEGYSTFDERLVQKNYRMALHLIQQDSGDEKKYKLNSREIDHIFPRATLLEKGYDESKINHFANLWIMEKGKNVKKSKKHPRDYFESYSDKELKKALIDRDMLEYRKFRRFLNERQNKIVECLKKKIGYSDSDFESISISD